MDSIELATLEYNNSHSSDDVPIMLNGGNGEANTRMEDSGNGDSNTCMEESGKVGTDVDIDCLMLNGKAYGDLTLDDMRDVKFSSQEEAERFYAYYALARGFGFRKHRLEWNSKRTSVIRRVMVCSREGERSVSKDGSGSENEIDYESDEEILVDNVKGKKDKRLRLSMADEVENGLCSFKRLRKRSHKSCRLSRCNCPASITFKKDRTCTFFYVSQFITEHNHPLTRRKHKHFVRSNRAVKDHDIAQVMSLRNVSVGTARAYEYLVHQAGGHEFVGFTERDLYNRVQREHSKLMMDGDAQASVTWMNLKAIRDPNFFCIFSVDDTGRLANMFWRDGQSYDDYCSFGDVLIFDSTYKTNIYDKPLAVFVGANNHRGTVIFGCALLADETEETYNWVLTAFLKSMNGQKPSSVITDSDEAMRNAVVNVIPEAKHRLCAWHVGRNVKSHLKDVDMQRDFFHLIFAGFTPAEWEVSWQYFVAMNNLEDNSWINGMYEKKDRWAEAFFREVFFGGICSTQRCEGMHRNMKIGLGSCMRLYELLPRLEKTSCRIRNGALYDDYRSDQFSAECKSHIRDMEEDIARIFTHDVFLLIRDQIYFEVKFILSEKVPDPETGGSVFLIAQYGKPERTWEVKYHGDIEDPDLSCSCKLFESDGIPCCHMFFAMKSEDLTKFPSSLVKKRWTKECFAPIKENNNVDKKTLQVARYGELMSACGKICHIASHSDEGYDAIKEVVNQLNIDIRALPQPTNTDSIDSSTEVGRSEGLQPNVIKDPLPCRSKGTKPKQPGGKQNQSRIPKKRTCSKCGQIGHDRRTCLASRMTGTNHSTTDLDTNQPDLGINNSDGCTNICGTSVSGDMGDSEDEAVHVSDYDTFHLIHNEEEARTFDFITGAVSNNSSSRQTNIEGGGGDYWRYYRPFPDSL